MAGCYVSTGSTDYPAADQDTITEPVSETGSDGVDGPDRREEPYQLDEADSREEDIQDAFQDDETDLPPGYHFVDTDIPDRTISSTPLNYIRYVSVAFNGSTAGLLYSETYLILHFLPLDAYGNVIGEDRIWPQELDYPSLSASDDGSFMACACADDDLYVARLTPGGEIIAECILDVPVQDFVTSLDQGPIAPPIRAGDSMIVAFETYDDTGGRILKFDYDNICSYTWYEFYDAQDVFTPIPVNAPGSSNILLFYANHHFKIKIRELSPDDFSLVDTYDSFDVPYSGFMFGAASNHEDWFLHVSWVNYDTDALYLSLYKSGTAAGGSFIITDDMLHYLSLTASDFPSWAATFRATQDEVGHIWVHAGALSPEAGPVEDLIQVSDGSGATMRHVSERYPSIAWTGSGFLCVWASEREYPSGSNFELSASYITILEP
jgi:hypothetical protein